MRETKDYRYLAIAFGGEDLMKLEQAIEALPFKRLERPMKDYTLFIPTYAAFKDGIKDVHEELFGTEVVVRIVGYGRSDTNEALRAEFLFDGKHQELDNILRKVSTPLITISLGKNGREMNSNKLPFRPIDNPFFITGKYVGFNSIKEIVGDKK